MESIISIILSIFIPVLANAYIPKSCIVFFSGGSNYMSRTIYSDFLSHIDPTKYDVIQFNKNIELDLEYSKYNEITYLAHSSGATTAINNISPDVNHLFLLDPVATPNLELNTISLDNIEYIDIINADLSYRWSRYPPFIPFIPVFKLDPSRLEIMTRNIKTITMKGYGHADLIDNPYRDIMHYTGLSRGSRDRSLSAINRYHNNLARYIQWRIDNKYVK